MGRLAEAGSAKSCRAFRTGEMPGFHHDSEGQPWRYVLGEESRDPVCV